MDFSNYKISKNNYGGSEKRLGYLLEDMDLIGKQKALHSL